MNSFLFFAITFFVIIAIIIGLLFAIPFTRKFIWKSVSPYFGLIIIVVLVLSVLLASLFLTLQYRSNRDFISGFGNSSPKSVLNDYANLVKAETDEDGKAPSLTQEENRKIETLGTGVGFPVFGFGEDFGIKNATESFRRLNQVKPLDSWEVVSEGENEAEGVLNFVNPDDEDDISTAKIFLKKESHLGFYPRWQIDKIETPEDLGSCFALLNQPASQLIPCFVERIKEIPGLFSRLAYVVKQFYDENLAQYLTGFRFSNPFI